MLAAEIESKVRTFLTDECGAPEGLGRDDRLFSTNTLDSLDIFSIINYLEGEFGVRVPPLEVGLDKMDSAAQIAEVVVSLRED